MLAFLASRIDRSTAILSATILLLCHGAFGALHLVPDPPTPPPLAGERAVPHHAPHGHGATAPEKSPGSHHPGATYFAVLLGTLLSGLALWLLRNARCWRDMHLSRRPSSGLSCAAVSNLPRGPTLPLLQVRRL